MKKTILLMLVLASCAYPVTNIPDVEANAPEIGAIVKPVGISLAIVSDPETAHSVTKDNFLVLEHLGDVSIVRSPSSVIVVDLLIKTVQKKNFGGLGYNFNSLEAVKISNTDGELIGWVPGWCVGY